MRLRTRLVGLVATLTILGIVIGLPVALLAIGANPLPDEVPTLEQLRVFFTSPDDGTLALGFIALVGWAAWAFLAASLALEGVARVRRTSSPHLPGLALPQSAARGLIGAALLLFVTAPVGMPTAHASAGTAATASAVASTPSRAAPVPSGQLAPPATPQAQVTPPKAKPSTIDHTVKRGDTLWSLAEAHLGDGARYGEIVELNPKTLGDDPGFLAPGTVLTIPTPATEAAGADGTRVVEPGDTLSKIANEELGDPERYPEIYEASKDTAQPGDRQLVDPDLILPGWTLTIPGAATPATSPTAPTPKARVEGMAPSSTSAAPHSVPSGETPGAESDRPPAASTPSIPSSQSAPVPASVTDARTVDVEETSSVAPWMLAGLVGGGGVLAGSMALLLLRRRRAQFRARRPGRTIATPEPVLVPVEKTVTAIGSTTAPTVEHLDAALRRLAVSHAGSGQAMPQVAAVQMTLTGLTLHLSGPSTLDAPWQGTEDHLHWTLPAQADAAAVGPLVEDQPAPYPMLCTIGASDAGDVWMLNLEDLDLVITGDVDYGRDFARYIAAEIACNPWSHGVTVDLIGVATEVAAMNPERVRVHTGDDPAADLVADAVAMIDRSQDAGTDVSTARAAQLGADPWPAKMLMVDAAADTTPALEQLLDLVRTHGGHTGTSVVVRGEELAGDGIEVQISASGRIVMPTSGLDLIAVGLTADEAQGCAALLAQSEDLEDVDIPSVDESDEESWKAWTDEAGALREEYTLPRISLNDVDEEDAQPAAPPTSILADPDEEYVEHGATTVADLNALAPRVTPQVRDAVLNADPTLDDDLERWHSDTCDLPRLTFLGPVTARTRGAALAKRKPYFTELLAYLVTRRHGATPDEVADTFNISQTKARDYVNTVRDWLGTNPRTGDKHLPDARKAPLAQMRGTSVYQVLDALVDADLFRRLRVRGEARGAEGIDDLCAALRLVQGRPFDNLRKGGWYWLSEGDRLDQHMVCAVVDVAHLITTHSLRDGDLKSARLAAETAALAAPDEEIPRLDLAAVAAAEGHANEADRILRDEILNRTDDDGPPAELSERTQQIIAGKDWLKRSQQAS